jgi:hypothetical protein
VIEREKQRTDQQKKHANEKKRRKPSKNDTPAQTEQTQAGMATDPQTMKDKGYVERIEEKTKKH